MSTSVDHLPRELGALRIANDEVEVVVHADHPTLNREAARRLADGNRIDLLATHSKYAPSQAAWLRPLDALQPYRLEMGSALRTRRTAARTSSSVPNGRMC